MNTALTRSVLIQSMVQSQTEETRHNDDGASANGTNFDALEMELKTLQEIHRLRNEIYQLNVAERGGYGSGGHSPRKVGSQQPRDPLVLHNDESHATSSSSPASNLCSGDLGYKRKICCIIVGVILILGILVGVMDVFHFMKRNGIELLPSSSSVAGTTPISLNELALHNTPDDCWVAIHGNVYDLTVYAKRHPGGPEWVTDLAGTDGTDAYDEFHSIGLLRSIRGNVVGPYLGEDGGGSDPGFGGNGMNNNSGGGSVVASSNGPVNCDTFVGNDMTTTCITMAELTSHNTAQDCWVGLHGHVYDLTEYANRHPAGPNWITKLAGVDGTKDYGKFHSPRLLNSVRQYLVGSLEGSIVSNAADMTNGGGGGEWEDMSDEGGSED